MYFEDFQEHQKFNTKGRTVTETDLVLFSTLTGAYNPLFLDEEFAKTKPFKGRIIPGILTLGLATGLTYQLSEEPFGTGFIALAGMSFKARAPVRPGDTLTVEVEVAEKTRTKSDRGAVTLQSFCRNQRNELVMEITTNILVEARSP